jgi:hypothetical protein
MAVKVEKLIMPRRLAEVIECKTVTSKSLLGSILKIYDFFYFEMSLAFY